MRFRATKDAGEVPVDLTARDGSEAKEVGLGVIDASRGGTVTFAWRKPTPGPGATSSANVRERAPKVDVFDVDGRSGKATLRKTFWNVRHFAAGPAGIFSVSPGGGLERLDGERSVRLPSHRDWLRIVAVGAARLVLEEEGGALFAYEVRGGRVTPLPPGAADVTIDPVTDDVVWVDRDAAIRWSPRRPAPESIPLR